jgi:NAD(P)-dependent dehydrogenase (short-subunit alcohol dehydrogenase family)
MHVQGTVALVTGANRGIGKAIAEELLARGAAKVYAGVRDVAAVTDPRLVAVQIDVTDADRVAAVARELDDVEIVVKASVAGSALDALEAGEPEAVVDEFSRAVKAGLSDDQHSLYPRVEEEFLAMVGGSRSPA